MTEILLSNFYVYFAISIQWPFASFLYFYSTENVYIYVIKPYMISYCNFLIVFIKIFSLPKN